MPSVGWASIHLGAGWMSEDVPFKLSLSNKGWHPQWFYLKNTATAGAAVNLLPPFTLDLPSAVPTSWREDMLEEAKMRMVRVRSAIVLL